MSPFAKPSPRHASHLMLFFITLLPATAAHADKVIYNYDSAGNRTGRMKEIIYDRGTSNPDGSKEHRYGESLSLVRISISPNPTDGELNIDITGTDTLDGASITIYGMNGGTLYYSETVSNANTIDMTSYHEGVYLLVISIGGESSSWKIIKNK